MIKGISRQIVEITDTQSPYFERMFLVVRQQCAECPPAVLDREAHKMITPATAYSGLKHARRRYICKQIGWILLGGALGACLPQLISPFL